MLNHMTVSYNLAAFTVLAVLTVLVLTTLKAGERRENKKLEGTTFYVQLYDKEGVPVAGVYQKCIVVNEFEFAQFLRRVDAKGLALASDSSDNPDLIASFYKIIPNERYRLESSHLTAIRRGEFWTSVEDVAIENETLLAVKRYLIENYKLPVETFPRVMYKGNNQAMEWDGILVCNNKTFLLECKHNMTDKQITKIVDRLREFKEKVGESDNVEYKRLIENQCIGVACGSLFPEALRNKSIKELGLAVVYPGGDRFKVEMPENLVC